MSDVAEEPGERSLHQTADGQSGLERRRICCDGPLILPDAKAGSSRLEEGLPTCTLSCPLPGELGGGWGEFEGFQESSAKPEQFSQSFGFQRRAGEHQPPRSPSIPKEHASCQVQQQGGPWVTGTAAGPSSEVFLWLSGKYFMQPLDFAQTAEHWGCGRPASLRIPSPSCLLLCGCPLLKKWTKKPSITHF